MMRDLHYRIALLMAQQEDMLYNKTDSFILFSLLQQHKIKCIDKYCFCKRRLILKSIQGTRMTINQDFMRRYILMLVHRMGDYFKNCKFTQSELIYFVHYVYLLNEFDQSTLALAQLNQMMFQNKNSKQHGLYQQTILAILNQHIKQRMTQNNLINKNDKVSVFTQIVESFLISEQKSKEVKKDILNVLDQKIKLFDSILMGKFETAQEMYESSNSITIVMNNTELTLEDLFFNYPSIKQRSIMCFYQAEILNNFYKAYAYQNLIVDNKVSQLYQKSPINFFASDMIYLIVAYGKQRGRIKSTSQKAASFFGYDKERFDFVQKIEDLIPPGIAGVHDAFVNDFFQTGQSGYFRNLSTSIAKLENGFIKPVELLFDINFLVQDEFTFVVFVREFITKNVFIIIDEQGRIGGLSENFFSQVGAPPELHRDVLIKLSQSLNINNLIPTFWDLMKQMQDQEVIEAKHFDVTLKFVKDLDRFVVKNSDLLKKNQTSELNLKASVAKKKRIKKNNSKDGQVNTPGQQNQLAMAYIRKSSFFNNDTSNNNITQNSQSYYTPNSTPGLPASDISDRSLHSHHTLNSRKTLRSAKSFISRKTLGWKKNKMAKFQTNIIIRARNFITDDASVAYKYYIIELEDLKKPVANDWNNSNSDSFASQNTTPQRSFMTMRTGKSINTLASGSFQISNHSLEEERDRNMQIDGEDHLYENQDSVQEQNQNRLQKYNTGLQPILEENNDNQKKNLGDSQNQHMTHQASIFSGKKQLGWVQRIVNMRKQKQQEEQDKNEGRQFITQVNTEVSEDKNIHRIKTEKIQNRQQTPLEQQTLRQTEEEGFSDDQEFDEEEEGDGDDDDGEENNDSTSNNQTSLSKASGGKKSVKSERSSKSSKKSGKSGKSGGKTKNVTSNKSIQSSSQQQTINRGPTIFVNNQEETASFTKGQTIMSHDNVVGLALANDHPNNENKSLLSMIQNQTNKLKSEEEETNNQNESSHPQFDSSKDIKQLNVNHKIGSHNKISFINLELFQDKKDPGSNLLSIVQEEKQASNLNGIDIFDHKGYFDDNILNESNRLAGNGAHDHSNFFQTLDRSNFSLTKNPEDSSGEKRTSLIKLTQNHMKLMSNSPFNESLSQKQISTGTSNNQIPFSVYSGQELDLTSNNYRGIPFLSKNQISNFSSGQNNESLPLRDDYLAQLAHKELGLHQEESTIRDYQQKFFNNENGLGESDIASQTIKRVTSIKENEAIEEQVAQQSQIYKTDQHFLQLMQQCFKSNATQDEKKQNGNNQINLNARQTDNIRASKQYFVYEKLNSFQESLKIPQSIQLGLSFWIIGLLIFIAFCLALLFSVRNQFNQFNDDLSLINVQNEIILPIDYFQTLSLINKQQMFNGYTPTNSNVTQIKSILTEGIKYYFSYFDQSLQTRLNENSAMNTWIDDEITVKMRDSANNYSEKSLPLLQVLRMLMNNMNELVNELQLPAAPQTKDVSYDSFFQQINFPPIIQYFDSFSQSVISQNNKLASDTETLLTEISLPMIFSSVLIFLISFYYLLKYKQLQESMMKFFYHTDKICLSRDIERYKVLKLFLTQSDDRLFEYKFSIKTHDTFLEAEDEFHEKCVTEMKQYKARLPDMNLRQSRIFFLFFFVFISYLIFIAGSFIYLSVFISNYQSLINNLQAFSRMSYRASDMMAERELCYAQFSTTLVSEFTPISEFDYQATSSMFKSEIAQLGNFIDTIGSLSFSMVDQSILNDIQSLFKSDLCPTITYDTNFYTQNRNIYDQACSYIQSGALKSGLITALNNFRNKLNLEYQETFFQSRVIYKDPNQILDDTLAFSLLSQKISQVTLEIIDNANTKKDSVNTILTIIICISMAVLGVFNFLLFIKGRRYLLQMYANNKLIIFLLPQQTVIMQHKLFNQLKTFLKNFDL